MEKKYFSQSNVQAPEEIAFGFQSNFTDSGAVVLGTGSGLLYTAHEYKVYSILLAEKEVLMQEEEQKLTGDLQFLRGYDKFAILKRARNYYEIHENELIQLYEIR